MSNLKNDASLSVRIALLIKELREKEDPRLKEISDVLENGRKSFISNNPQTNFDDPMNAYKSHVEGCKTTFDYIEAKYPDLYGFLQTANYTVH